MGAQGDQIIYDFLSKVSEQAQGVLTPMRRAELVAELRERIETERDRERDRSGRVRFKGKPSEDEIAKRAIERVGDARSVVAAERRRNPPPPGSTTSMPGSPAFPTMTSAASASPSRFPDSGDTAEIPVVPPGVAPDAGRSSPAEEMAANRRAAVADHGTVIGHPAVPLDAAQPSGEPGSGGWGGMSLRPVRPPTGVPGPLSLPAMLQGYAHEAVAIAVLLFGAVFSLPPLVFIGYVVALTSGAWSAGEKRFALFGVPVLTLIAYVTALWLRASGRWGGSRMSARSIFEQAAEVIASVPRVIGLLAALYLVWRLLRLRAEEQ